MVKSFYSMENAVKAYDDMIYEEKKSRDPARRDLDPIYDVSFRIENYEYSWTRYFETRREISFSYIYDIIDKGLYDNRF